MDIHLSQDGFSYDDIRTVFTLEEAQGRINDWFRQVTGFIHLPCDNHPENMDSGEAHSLLSEHVYGILAALGGKSIGLRTLTLASNHFDAFCSEIPDEENNGFTEINLFEVFRPVFVKVFFDLLFESEPAAEELALLIKGNKNFHYAMKGAAIPDHRIRRKMYALIGQRFERHRTEALASLQDETRLTDRSKMSLLGGAFFDTAVVQMVDLLSHASIELSRHRDIERALLAAAHAPDAAPDQSPLVRAVLNESLRLYPLFGNTNRVAIEPFQLGGRAIPIDTRFYLNFKHLHARSLEDGSAFRPQRWLRPRSEERNRPQEFCPFGLGPRRCPAKTLSMEVASATLLQTVKTLHIIVPDTLAHTRRLFRGAPAWVAARHLEQSSAVDGLDSFEIPSAVRSRLERKVARQYDIGDTFIWYSPLETLRIVLTTMWQQRAFQPIALFPLVITVKCLWHMAMVRAGLVRNGA